MARLARKASQIEPRSVGRLSQGPYGREIATVRGLRSRSALLRLDRQPDQAHRRRPIRNEGDAAQTREQMVRHQSPTLDETEDGRAAEAGGSGRCPEREQIRSEAKHS